VEVKRNDENAKILLDKEKVTNVEEMEKRWWLKNLTASIGILNSSSFVLCHPENYNSVGSGVELTTRSGSMPPLG
jgi:hypothetical protein